MGNEYTREVLDKKAERINRDFGLDIEIERYNGAYRAVTNKQSKNLTNLVSKKELWYLLDAYEDGLLTGMKIMQERIRLRVEKEMKLLGVMTGRSASMVANFAEKEEDDGRQRTEGDGK